MSADPPGAYGTIIVTGAEEAGCDQPWGTPSKVIDAIAAANSERLSMAMPFQIRCLPADFRVPPPEDPSANLIYGERSCKEQFSPHHRSKQRLTNPDTA